MNPTPKRKRGRPPTEFLINGQVFTGEALGDAQKRNAEEFLSALERVLRRQIQREAKASATASEPIDENHQEISA